MPRFERNVTAALSPGDEFVFTDGSHPAYIGKVDKVIAYFTDKGTQVLYQSTSGQYHHPDKIAPIPNNAKEKGPEKEVRKVKGFSRQRDRLRPAPGQEKEKGRPAKKAGKGAGKRPAPAKKKGKMKSPPPSRKKGAKARRS